MALLSDTERKFYENNGYIVVRNVLDEPIINAVLATIARAVDVKARALRSDGTIQELHEQLPVTRRWIEIQRQTSKPIGKRGWNAEVFGHEMFSMLAAPAVLDVIESLIGPEIVIHGDYWIRPKLPYEDRTTIPWHQDSSYYGPGADKATILTVWIPLVNVDENNGCMQVIPGSHKSGLQPAGRASADDPFVPNNDPTAGGAEVVTLPMNAGDLLAFNNLTFHRSLMNVTDDIRWSADLRYSPAGEPLAWLFEKYPSILGRSKEPSAVETFDQWLAKRQMSPRTRSA